MLPRIKRAAVLALLVLLTLGAADSVAPPTLLTVRFVWEEPVGPLFDCGNPAYAMNNPDKCDLRGPFLLGGDPEGSGGGIGRILHDLTGGLL